MFAFLSATFLLWLFLFWMAISIQYGPKTIWSYVKAMLVSMVFLFGLFFVVIVGEYEIEDMIAIHAEHVERNLPK